MRLVLKTNSTERVPNGIWARWPTSSQRVVVPLALATAVAMASPAALRKISCTSAVSTGVSAPRRTRPPNSNCRSWLSACAAVMPSCASVKVWRAKPPATPPAK